jgi:signal transduction histidine kinase
MGVRENDRLKRQIGQLQAVLDNLTTGVSLLEPLYDKTRQLVDFKNVIINAYNARRFGKSMKELTDGRGIGKLFPGWQQTENFAIYQQVLEDQQPHTFNTFHDQFGLRSWLEVEVRPLGTGVLVSYKDITVLRESEQKQRDQAGLLQVVINNAYVGIGVYEPVLDEQGQVVDFCIQFTKPTPFLLPAYTRQPAGEPLSSSVDSDEQALFQKHRSVYQTGQTLRVETYHPEVGIWVEESIAKLSEGIIHTLVDITERKRIESQFVYQADTFQAVLEAITHGLNVFQIIRNEAGQLADLRYEFVSDQMLRDSGLTRQQVIGNTLLSLFPTARQSAYWPAYQAALQTGQSQRFEEFYQYDGFQNYTIGEVCLHKQDRLITTYRIINELKAAQGEAQQQAELIRSVLDGSPNAVIAFDAVRDQTGTLVDLRYVLQNEVNRQRVGRSDDQLLGQTMRMFFPEVVESGLLEGYRRVIETGQPWHWEGAYVYPKGSGWFGYTAVKRGDGMVLTVQDKTREHDAQQRIEVANRALLKSNENLQQFAYVASHDLQEPLRKIQSFGDILKTQYAGKLGEGVPYLERMQLAAGRMSTLIRDLLAYARISIKQEVSTRVSLHEVIQGVLSDLDLSLQETNAQLEVASLPSVVGDASQLGQLFQNLLSNALKFRRPDTSPRIQVRAKRVLAQGLPPMVHPTQLSETYYCVEVVDDGIGFDETYVDRIFQVFQRLHGKGSFVGTGIGLAICQKVAENHGGAITARSQPGQGATFSVYLPV